MAAMSGACQPTALSCGQGKLLDIVDASCNVLGLLWCDCWVFFCSPPKNVSCNVQKLCQNRPTCELQANKLCDGGRYLNVKYNCTSQEPNGYAPEAPVEKMPIEPASASVEQDGDHQEANVGETEFPDLSEGDASPLDPKLIAAIAIAGVVVLLLILIVMLICLRRRQNKGSTTVTEAAVDEKPKGLFEMVGQVAVSDYNQTEDETSKLSEVDRQSVASDDDQIEGKSDGLSEGDVQSVVSDGEHTEDKPNDQTAEGQESADEAPTGGKRGLDESKVANVAAEDKPNDQTAKGQESADEAPADGKSELDENEVANVAAEDNPAATYAVVKKSAKNI